MKQLIVLMIVLFANNAFAEQSDLDDLYQETKRANQERQANELEQIDIQEKQLQIMRNMEYQQNEQNLRQMYPEAFYKKPYGNN